MKEDLQRFVAKDIQSRCRNLREMKDVFKELKVLGRERKSCTSQINKDILETIFTSTSTFSSTILVTFLRVVLEPPFQKKTLFLYLLCLLPRVDPLLRE